MSDLRTVLDREAARAQVPADGMQRVERRMRRHQRRRQLLVVAVTLLVFAGSLTGVLVAFLGGRDISPSPATRLRITANVRLPHGVNELAAGEGAVWVLSNGFVSRIDPATDRVVASIRVPGAGELNHIAVGEGAVWVTAAGSHPGIVRIDPRTNQVTARVPLRGQFAGVPVGIATGGGSVWFTVPGSGTGRLGRLDPKAGVLYDWRDQTGSGPGPLAYASGGVWVVNTSPLSMVHVSIPRGVVTPAPGLSGQQDVAIGYGAGWSVGNDTLVRFDPATGRVLGTIQIQRASEVVVGDGYVWVLAATGSKSSSVYIPDPHQPAEVYRVDPRTDRVLARPTPVGQSPEHLTVGEGAVWVGHGETLTRLEACTTGACSSAPPINCPSVSNYQPSVTAESVPRTRHTGAVNSGSGRGGEPEPDMHVVVLASLPSHEAPLLIGRLEEAGIHAVASPGGSAPGPWTALPFMPGLVANPLQRGSLDVLVNERDLDEAQKIAAEFGVGSSELG